MIQLPPPTISTAEDLLVQFEQTGDTAPFEEIVRRYSGMVYGVCYRVTRNAHDAEDATQATFLKLATYARTGFGTRGDSDRMSEPGRPPRVGPWLQQVAKTTSVDLRRSKTRRQNREQIRAAIEDQQQPTSDATDDVSMDELKQVLRDEVDQLPVHYRTPLILYYFGGLSTEQIAVELKTNAKALAVRLFRARKMLGSRLTARGVGAAGSAVACLAVADSILAALAGKVWQTAGTSGIYAGGGLFASAGGGSWLTSHSAVLSTITSRINATMRAAAVGMVASKWKMSVGILLTVGTTMAGTSEVVQQSPAVQEVTKFLQEVGESIKNMGNFGRSLRGSTPGLRAEVTPPTPLPPIENAPQPVPPIKLEKIPDQGIASDVPKSSFATPKTGTSSVPPTPRPAGIAAANGGTPASTNTSKTDGGKLNLPSASQSLLAMGNSSPRGKSGPPVLGKSGKGGAFVGPIALADGSGPSFEQLFNGTSTSRTGPFRSTTGEGSTDGSATTTTTPGDSGPIATGPVGPEIPGVMLPGGDDVIGIVDPAVDPALSMASGKGTDFPATDGLTPSLSDIPSLIDPTPMFGPVLSTPSTQPASPIPEPGALGLLALGAAGLLARRRRR